MELQYFKVTRINLFQNSICVYNSFLKANTILKLSVWVTGDILNQKNGTVDLSKQNYLGSPTQMTSSQPTQSWPKLIKNHNQNIIRRDLI